jgi:hypothetical protein
MSSALQLTMGVTPPHHNQYLFSDHYLENILPDDPRWEVALGEVVGVYRAHHRAYRALARRTGMPQAHRCLRSCNRLSLIDKEASWKTVGSSPRLG